MSKMVDESYRYQVIRKTCYSANIIYLFIRLFYLILFLISKLYIMVGITAGTILFYFLFFVLLKKKKYYLYALLCGNEFFAFIIASTLLVGFSSGFHFYLIGLCVVSFFTSYFNKVRSVKGTIIWAGLSLAIYLTLYFVTRFNPPYYAIERWLEMTLFTTHAIAVFAFIAVYLLVFIKYAFSLEGKIINESRTDELTQVKNRYGLYDYFEQEDKTSSYLALFDIDDFKTINDTYGHVTGDGILKRVATITTNTLPNAFFCRYGGEEFVLVLKDEEKSYFDQLEELRKNIEKEVFEYKDERINVTITIGRLNILKNIP